MGGIKYMDNKGNGINTIKICDFDASGPISDSLDSGCFLLTANGT